MKNTIKEVLILLSLLFSGCLLDPQDYDSNPNFAVKGDLNLRFPIASNSYSLAISERFLKDTSTYSTDVDGFLIYKLERQKIAEISGETFIDIAKIDEKSSFLVSTVQEAQFNNIIAVGEKVALNATEAVVSLVVNTDADVDKMYFDTGTFSIQLFSEVAADLEVVVTFPELTLLGETTSFQKTLEAPYDPLQGNAAKLFTYSLVGATLDLSVDNPSFVINDENVLVISATSSVVKTSSDQQINALDEVSFYYKFDDATQPRMGLGSFEGVSLEEDNDGRLNKQITPLSLDIFSSLKETFQDADFRLRGTALSIEFVNSTGVVIEGSLQLTGKNNTDGKTVDMLYGAKKGLDFRVERSFDIENSSKKPDSANTLILLSDTHETVELQTNFHEIYAIYPDSLLPSLSLSPIEKDPTSIPHFIHSKSSLDAYLKGNLYFDIKIGNFYIYDTIEFSVVDVFENVFKNADSIVVDFIYTIQNSIPLDLSIIPYFMAADFSIIEPLDLADTTGFSLVSIDVTDDGTPTETSNEVEKVFQLVLSKERYTSLKDKGSEFLYLKILLETPKEKGTDNLLFVKLKDNYELGITLKGIISAGFNTGNQE